LPKRTDNKGPTHGRLLGKDGVPILDEVIRSHEDPSVLDGLALTAVQRLSDSLRSHVEAHVAAAMRRGEVPHDAVVVLNNRTCRGPLSCDTFLPSIMPPRARLTVFVTDGERVWWGKTYHGTGERIVGR
jgi:hypothetical protein